MRGISLSILLKLILVAACIGQTSFREADIKINGIGSGSSYQEVLNKFGKPRRQKVYRSNADEPDCVGFPYLSRTLFYAGLTIELLGEKNANLRVVSMSVTSGKWVASGIKIGDPVARVIKVFGVPISEGRDGRHKVLEYVTPGNLGGVNFAVGNGRIKSIKMSETIC